MAPGLPSDGSQNHMPVSTKNRTSRYVLPQQLEWFCSTIKTNNRGAYESCQKKDRGVVIQTKMSNVSA
ncbi:hypothetical protein F443_00143 [Phytophthora nicotianae P1569]|uniref:Uncharacterized protein n=1 Tax=Phytophthora nicotianae P1569 TaxID=1317065 RepID=V9G2F6_PHYNI|nr:hypothetical protein F443_00143 [Phytophthora nicotianae P1569]